MTLQIPLIRFLSGHDLFPGLLAESLGSGQIGMPARSNIFLGPLGNRDAPDQEQSSKSSR